MWRDHFRSCWRGVLNNRLTTFINVGGLALGLAVFFALIFHVQREFSWDAHWQDADRIYTLAGSEERSGGSSLPLVTNAPYVVGTSLQSLHPEAFEDYARVLQLQGTVSVGGEEYANRRVFHAEPALLNLLQLEVLEGSLGEAFADPHSVALASEAAKNLFGQDSPLGRTLTFDSPRSGSQEYTVRAVYRVPEPSTFAGWQFLAPFDPAAPAVGNVGLDNWNASPERPVLRTSHYFKLREGAEAAQLEADLNAFMDKNGFLQNGTLKTRYGFLPLQDVHLLATPLSGGNEVERLWIYAAVGALVLLISGCNFVMLATLRSVDRMREIGIRKVVGGEAAQLMRQHLLDVFCQTLAAALLAVALLEFSLPVLQARLSLPLEPGLLSWRGLVQALCIVAGFTLASGLYPAFLMTRGQPATLLRDSGAAVASSGSLLRRLLVGMQFGIVIVLLLASLVAQQQIEYTRNRDRGYSLENVVSMIASTMDLQTKAPALTTEFERIPGVAAAASGNLLPGAILMNAPERFTFTASDGSVTEAALRFGSSVGIGFFGVTSVPVLAGREFTLEVEGALPLEDTRGGTLNIVLNAAAARALGFMSPETAVGQLLATGPVATNGGTGMRDLRVVGVVADTQFSSLMLPPVPQYYIFYPGNGHVVVRLEPGAERTAIMPELERVWREVMGAAPFMPLEAAALEANQLAREESEARIVIGSAVLAMVIALLGLYGLVAATVVKRVKEIGVRKAMGAGRASIVALLLWQFSKPIVIANLVAWPLGLWAITRWLERFPYQLDTGVIMWSAIAASMAALLIAWLTVGLMAAKAASQKPVLALRYE